MGASRVGLCELHRESSAAGLGLRWGSIIIVCEVMSWLRYGSITVLLWPLLQLPHQPEQRLCYGRHAIQERLTVCSS